MLMVERGHSEKKAVNALLDNVNLYYLMWAKEINYHRYGRLEFDGKSQ